MPDKELAQRKIAWDAATRTEAAATAAFGLLAQANEDALDIKNRAMRLVPEQAETLEAEWASLQNLVDSAIHDHARLEAVPHFTHPEYGPRRFRALRVQYRDARQRAVELERELGQFALRCEANYFTPAGLREWASQVQDDYTRLSWLSLHMMVERIEIPPLADADELQMLLQEAGQLMRRPDNSGRVVDVLEDAERLAVSIEKQLAAQLNLDDNKHIDSTVAIRQASWAESNLIAARQKLNELADASDAAVQEAAQSLADADERLAEAQALIAGALVQLEDPAQTGSNAQHDLVLAVQLCWEIDTLCLAVDHLSRNSR